MDRGLLLLIACLATDFHCSKAASNDAVHVSVAAMSRPFMLGELYDATKDVLITGLDLWNKTTVAKRASIELFPNTASQLIVGTSFSKKALSLRISAEIQVSFFLGLFKGGGAVKFLYSITGSHYVAEVSVQYHRRTHVASLGMEVLDNVEYPDVFDRNTGATHVVTAIEYGADAFLQFREESGSREQHAEVEGDLKGSVNAVIAHAESSRKVNLTGSEKKKYSSIACIFNGDVKLPNPPATLLEVIEVYRTIPGLIDTNTAVPITVYLTPLYLLDSRASRMVRQISKNLLNQVAERFGHYDDIQLSIGDLERTRAYVLLPQFQNLIKNFEVAVVGHKNKFQKQLLDVLPKIRQTGAEEIELVKILEKSHEKYTIDELESYLLMKQKEASALDEMLSQNPRLIVTDPGDFEKILFNKTTQYVISFTLQLYPKADTFIECVSKDCGRGNASSSQCSELNCANVDEWSNSWLNDHSFASLIYDRFYHFMQVVEKNAQIKPSTVMIIREIYWQKDKQQTYNQETELYHEKELVEKDFQPTVSQNVTYYDCAKSVVAWNIEGSDSISEWLTGEYIVKHRPVSHSQWTERSVIGRNELWLPYAQNQGFEVVVFAMCSFGVCAISDEVHSKTFDNPACLPKPHTKVLVIGGDEAKAMPSMELYSPFNPQLNRIVANVTLLQPRYYHTSALMDDGSVITVGGFYRSPLSSCERFNPETKTLNSCPPLNTPRQYAASSVINGVLYVCGGYTGTAYLATCERLHSGVWQDSVSMTVDRYKFAMVSLDGYLYAIGGNDPLNTVECRRSTDQHWTLVQSMNKGRAGHSAAVMGGKIFVCGGITTLTSCEQYDPNHNQWMDIAPMNQQRSFFGLVSDGFNLFALGGDQPHDLTVAGPGLRKLTLKKS